MGEKVPIVIINPGFIMYANVSENDVSEIVSEHLLQNRPVSRLAIQTNALFNRFYRVFGDVSVLWEADASHVTQLWHYRS